MTIKLSNHNTTNQDIYMESNTPPRMRTGTDEFYDLVVNSDVFVDKSLMIKELLKDSGKVILITRPRRWGKSLNMNMLQKFFEIEVDQNGVPLPTEDRVHHILFTGGIVDLGFDETKELKPLKIASDASSMKRQGQFPVILLNLKDVKGSSYQEIENGIRNQVTKLFVNHRYLKHYIAKDENLLDDIQKEKLSRYFTGKLDKEDLKDGLCFLSEVLYKHFDQKVIYTTKAILSLYICNYSSGWKTLMSHKIPIQQEGGKITGIFGQVMDISNTNMFNWYLALNQFDKKFINLQDKPTIYVLSQEHSPLPLSKKQQECVFLMLRGKSMKEIATILNLSVRTVESYFAIIKLKLGCSNKSQIIEKAINSGFLHYIPNSIIPVSTK